jgi:GNAT superfamily N-acetyltransferase
MTFMKFTFEPARLDDVPDLIALLDTLFSIEQDFTPQSEKQRHGLERLLADPARACIMVAREPAGRAIAMVSAQLVISTAEGAPSAWVEDMVVSDSYRGQGLGKQLLAALLDWARDQGATRAQLLADLDNTPALAFYDHLGWQPTRLGARRVAL